MTTIHSGATVGELVAERPSRSRLFERLGIDYCCGGRRPLDEACAAAGADLEQVLRDVADHDQATPLADETDWTTAPLAELCDHIVATHHDYLRSELPRLDGLTEKVASAHATTHPYVVELRRVFVGLQSELTMHMMKEEQILFPICKQLEASSGPVQFHCGSVDNPIRVMVDEHDSAAAALRRMSELTSGYTPPDDACNTFRALLDALQQLELDLHQHIHKENNILFPRASRLQAELQPAG